MRNANRWRYSLIAATLIAIAVTITALACGPAASTSPSATDSTSDPATPSRINEKTPDGTTHLYVAATNTAYRDAAIKSATALNATSIQRISDTETTLIIPNAHLQLLRMMFYRIDGITHHGKLMSKRPADAVGQGSRQARSEPARCVQDDDGNWTAINIPNDDPIGVYCAQIDGSYRPFERTLRIEPRPTPGALEDPAVGIATQYLADKFNAEAAGQPLPEDRMINGIVEVDTADIEDVSTFLTSKGVTITSVREEPQGRETGATIKGYFPLGVILDLEANDKIKRFQDIPPPQPASDEPGLTEIPTEILTVHNQGLTGEGVHVGVIDVGFRNFAPIANALSPTPQALCFKHGSATPTNDIADCEDITGVPGGHQSHGTQVVNNLITIAPDVTLYIA